MNVLVVSGSRNREGQTASAANAMLRGVREAGGQGEIVFLPTLSIERCRQCEDSGWGLCATENRCVIEDDLDAVTARIRDADAVVFATPVYYGSLSESLRAFLDRMRRVVWRQPKRGGMDGKPAVVLCVAGGGGGGAPRCAAELQESLSQCGFDVLDVVPARRQNLAMKIGVLEHVGRWLAGDRQ